MIPDQLNLNLTASKFGVILDRPHCLHEQATYPLSSFNAIFLILYRNWKESLATHWFYPGRTASTLLFAGIECSTLLLAVSERSLAEFERNGWPLRA